ncbi:hypothetical protein AB0M43_37430 [Longispora sp. NPDC051575]|uniref:hypothetical protein n=1 Tax=Longispora sp. NPDC051575 TaxID=3154943 RepID=UPI003417AA6D
MVDLYDPEAESPKAMTATSSTTGLSCDEPTFRPALAAEPTRLRVALLLVLRSRVSDVTGATPVLPGTPRDTS